VLSFWLVYILTRPLGANLGDWFASPSDQQGLGLGYGITSVIFLATIVALRPRECSIVAAGGVLPAGERQLHLNLGRRAVPHLLLRRGDLLYALMPVTDQSLAALRQRLGGEATVGISDPLARPGRAPTAVREATWAARVARTTPDRIARFAGATMFSVLRDTDEAQVVVDRVLGPLIAYDARHSAEMIKTLDTYLQCDRSWVQTAAVLNVHRQTVVYRIQRIEQITGRAISETAALAEFWLALRARDLLALPHP
jgi:PucR family transcriptional regulator, purine catabolism regulatory protein